MAVMSKRFFESIVKDVTCNEVVHPRFANCTGAHFNLFKNSLKGCMMFFLSIYVLELITKYKKIDKAYLEKHVKNFLRSYVYGILYTNGLYSSICMFRYLTGRFNYYVLLFPGIIGALSIFFESPIMKSLDTVMYFEMVLEMIVTYLSGENFIKRSVTKDTLCFMLFNSIFLYLLKNNPLSKEACILWFFNPRNKTKNEKNMEKYKCCKNVICAKHLLEVGCKYFSAGYSFQIARYLVKNINQIQKPSSFIRNLFSKKALKTGIFFGSYVTIYKLMCRYLQELDGTEKPNHALLAGFFSGIPYCIDPNLQISMLSVSMIFQILWINIRTKYKIPKWYLKEIFFSICSGILMHSLLMAPDYCPKYVKNMVYSVSDGEVSHVLQNFNTYVDNKLRMKLIS